MIRSVPRAPWLLDQLDADRFAAGPGAHAGADRAGGHDVLELGDEACGRAVAGVALSRVVALDVRAVQAVAARDRWPAQLEEREARHAVPDVRAVAAEVAGRAAVIW